MTQRINVLGLRLNKPNLLLLMTKMFLFAFFIHRFLDIRSSIARARIRKPRGTIQHNARGKAEGIVCVVSAREDIMRGGVAGVELE